MIKEMKFNEVSAIEAPYTGIDTEEYRIEKRRLQVELLRIQRQLIKKDQRLAIVFEGRDAAGKGSTIKRFTEHMIPSHTRTVALGIPDKNESRYWFKRYEKQLPHSGQITFFDRSWYNRAVVEPVMGFCTQTEHHTFLRQVPMGT